VITGAGAAGKNMQTQNSRIGRRANRFLVPTANADGDPKIFGVNPNTKKPKIAYSQSGLADKGYFNPDPRIFSFQILSPMYSG
jgi:hypothetical protein